MNYFEDLEIGTELDLGSHVFTREEIIDFARKFDPQPFHLDEAAAAKTHFGRLCASGWHTTALWVRHQVDHRKRIADQIAYLGGKSARFGPSPGFEDLKWLKPVYVGDTLRFSSVITRKVDSRSRPAVGLLISEGRAHNQAGELVLSLTTKIFVERRTPLPPAGV